MFPNISVHHVFHCVFMIFSQMLQQDDSVAYQSDTAVMMYHYGQQVRIPKRNGQR